MVLKSLKLPLLLVGFVIIMTSPLLSSAEEKKEEANRLVFKDKVKSIRSVVGDYDVFFNEHFGPYSVPFSLPNSKQNSQTPEAILKEAHKKGMAITVTVDTATDTIIAIDADEVFRKPAASSNDDTTVPPEVEEFKDLVKKYSSPAKN